MFTYWCHNCQEEFEFDHYVHSARCPNCLKWNTETQEQIVEKVLSLLFGEQNEQ